MENETASGKRNQYWKLEPVRTSSKISKMLVENKIGSGKRNIRNASGKQNQSNKKITASGKQKINNYKSLHRITTIYNFISH